MWPLKAWRSLTRGPSISFWSQSACELKVSMLKCLLLWEAVNYVELWWFNHTQGMFVSNNNVLLSAVNEDSGTWRSVCDTRETRSPYWRLNDSYFMGSNDRKYRRKPCLLNPLSEICQKLYLSWYSHLVVHYPVKKHAWPINCRWCFGLAFPFLSDWA